MILDLVSRWINFCETEHQSYCSLSIWVAMVTFEKTFYTNLNATPLYCRIQLFSSFKLFFLWIPNLLEKKSPPTPVLWHQMYPIMERHLYHRHSVNCQVLTSITFILSFSLKAFQKFRHSWLTCLAVQGSSISRSLCLTVRAYQTITRVILAGHFPKMFLFHHCCQDSARNKDMGEREDERSD